MQGLLIKGGFLKSCQIFPTQRYGPASLLDFTVEKMVEFAGGFLKECRKEHSESLDHVISPGRSAAQFCLLVSTCYRLATFIGRQHHELLHFIYYANYKLWEISSSHVLADGQIRELRGKKSAAF